MSVPRDEIWTQDPATLSQEIDETRADVGDTLDALQEKLSPSTILDQSVSYLGERGYEFACRVTDTVRQHPVPFALAAAGLVWFVAMRRSAGEETLLIVEDEDELDEFMEPEMSTEFSTEFDSSGIASTEADAMSPGVAQRAKERVRSAAQGTRQRAAGATRAARQRASQLRGTAEQRARRAGGEFSRLLQEQPLLVGAVGVAIGAALAALIPLTQQEERLLGEQGDRLVSQAKQKAGEQVQKVRETAKQAAEGARRAVEESRQSNGSSGEAAAPGA
jgi:ElaB/YqjD/DUF883 family membrane-anchored ribosome-binding protein